MRLSFLFICLLAFNLATASLNQITGLKVYRQAHSCRLDFDTSKPAHFHQLMLKKPPRLVLDVSHADFVRFIERQLLQGTPINNIRTGYKKNKVLRIVFDLKHSVQARTRVLAADRYHHSPRLSVQLQWQATHPHKHSASKRPVYLSAYQNRHSMIKRLPTHSTVPPASQRASEVIVVIDPGHGGHDPGASGAGGAREKTVVLHIARQLQKNLNQLPGFKAYLTRRGDYYLSLRQRLAIARKYRPDIFVAIHADAYPDRSARGASVFALSSRGATSEAARWLAKRENESELMGGVDLSDKTSLLKSVLLNLSQTATIRASLRIGQQMIYALHDVASLHHGRVEQAAFVVLKSPDIPSLLVETGFISNRFEAKKLRDRYYQRRLAAAISQGIRNYFVRRPPRGTWLAAHRG